jgi:hypothetical protein
MSAQDNKALVVRTKSILNGLGYKVTTSELYELFSKLAGDSSWNVASAKGTDFRRLLEEDNPFPYTAAPIGLRGALIKAFKVMMNETSKNFKELELMLVEITSGAHKDRVVLGLAEDTSTFVTVDPVVYPGQLFIGGMGSGKSAALRFSIFAHMMANSRNTVYLFLDLEKGMADCREAFKYPANVVPVLDSYCRFEFLMDLLDEEIKARRAAFVELGAVNIYDYEAVRRKSDPEHKGLSRIMLCIDGLHVLSNPERTPFLSELESPGKAGHTFKELLRVGRSLGFNMIAATQRGNRQNIPTQLMSGISFVMTFRINNPGDAEVGGASANGKIAPSEKGRCAYHNGFMQFPYMSEDAGAELLRRHVQPLEAELLARPLEVYHIVSRSDEATLLAAKHNLKVAEPLQDDRDEEAMLEEYLQQQAAEAAEEDRLIDEAIERHEEEMRKQFEEEDAAIAAYEKAQEEEAARLEAEADAYEAAESTVKSIDRLIIANLVLNNKNGKGSL